MTARDTASSPRAPRGQWLLASASLLLAFACLVLPSHASAQATPQGCGYGTGGPYASNLCWFDMTAYNDTLARSGSGQPMSVTLPGGYTVTFTLTSRPVAGAPNYPVVDARAVPIERRFAFGSSDYIGVPGMPALYSRDAGNNGVSLTLSNVTVVDSSGAPVTGYSFVIADAENNITTENFTWTSDKPLSLIGVMNPTSTRGCHNALTGVGTTSVTCTGQGTDPPGALSSTVALYDGVMVGASTPSTIGLSLRTPARSGVAFAIMTSKIHVTKSVVGRVRGSDSFDVSATSPEGSTIGSASTGSGSSATTGALTVLPRTNGSSYTLAEAATPGSGTRLADYSQSWSCTNAATSSPTPLPSGSGTSVTVSPAPGDDISCTVTNTQMPVDLAVVKTALPSPAVPGTNETYTLRVTNNGPSRATNARVSDQLPSGLSFVSASSACGEAGGTVTCTAGTLDPGASQTFSVTAKIASSAKSCVQLTNTATAASDTPDSDPGNNASSLCVPIRGASGLSISKTPSVAELPVGGGQLMYTLVVENAGPSDATGVQVTDGMAPGLTLVAVDPSQGACSTTGGKVACDLGSLVAGGSAQVLVTAQTWGTPGAITNTATVSADQDDSNPGDNTASATVSVPAVPSPPSPSPPPPAPTTFDLAVSKTANHRTVSVGQRVTYKIVVANKGPAAAPAVKLTDTLDAPASVVSVKTTAGSCAKAIPMTCSVGTISGGGKVIITVVTEPKQSGCRQRNAASATGEGTDASPASNLATVDLCARKVALRLSKVADRSKATAGGMMRYTIRVSNPTKARARNVKTCDRLPSALVYVSSRSKAKLTGGSYCWTAKALAAGASLRYRITVRILRGASGTRVNRATVNGLQAHTRKARAAIRVLPARAQAGGVTG
jgi:uncharacterized repeat protein (TIGR01451 family)